MNKWDIRAIEQWAEEFEIEVMVYLSAVAAGLVLAFIVAKLIGR